MALILVIHYMLYIRVLLNVCQSCFEIHNLTLLTNTKEFKRRDKNHGLPPMKHFFNVISLTIDPCQGGWWCFKSSPLAVCLSPVDLLRSSSPGEKSSVGVFLFLHLLGTFFLVSLSAILLSTDSSSKGFLLLALHGSGGFGFFWIPF